MDKLDIFMALLGLIAYMAIMIDLRNYERRMVAFEAIQEKRRKYAELQAEKRRIALEREKAIKEKVAEEKQQALEEKKQAMAEKETEEMVA